LNGLKKLLPIEWQNDTQHNNTQPKRLILTLPYSIGSIENKSTVSLCWVVALCSTYHYIYCYAECCCTECISLL